MLGEPLGQGVRTFDIRHREVPRDLEPLVVERRAEAAAAPAELVAGAAALHLEEGGAGGVDLAAAIGDLARGVAEAAGGLAQLGGQQRVVPVARPPPSRPGRSCARPWPRWQTVQPNRFTSCHSR